MLRGQRPPALKRELMGEERECKSSRKDKAEIQDGTWCPWRCYAMV